MELDTRERADRVLDAARWRKGDDVFGRVGAEMKCVQPCAREKEQRQTRACLAQGAGGDDRVRSRCADPRKCLRGTGCRRRPCSAVRRLNSIIISSCRCAMNTTVPLQAAPEPSAPPDRARAAQDGCLAGVASRADEFGAAQALPQVWHLRQALEESGGRQSALRLEEHPGWSALSACALLLPCGPGEEPDRRMNQRHGPRSPGRLRRRRCALCW